MLTLISDDDDHDSAITWALAHAQSMEIHGAPDAMISQLAAACLGIDADRFASGLHCAERGAPRIVALAVALDTTTAPGLLEQLIQHDLLPAVADAQVIIEVARPIAAYRALSAALLLRSCADREGLPTAKLLPPARATFNAANSAVKRGFTERAGQLVLVRAHTPFLFGVAH